MNEAAFHQLVPEEPHVVPTVGVDAIWLDLVGAITGSPARDRLFAMHAEREVFNGKEHSDRLRTQETAVAILNNFLRNGQLVLRINSGSGFYRVPTEAFVSQVKSVDGQNGVANADATTWSKGVLYRTDTTKPFEWIAAGRYTLLVTKGEAAFVRERTREIIAQEERIECRGTRDATVDRTLAGEITPQGAEDAARLMNEPRWDYMTALAWIGLRDAAAVAKVLATRPAFYVVIGGPKSNIEWLQRTLRAMPGAIVNCPLDVMLAGLRTPGERAWGRLNGAAATTPIGPEQWDSLDFADLPETGMIDNYVTDWRMGAKGWRAVWSDLRFDRDKIMADFPPRQPDNPDSDEKVGATIERLIREHGGHLPQNDGAVIVRELHPSRRRDELRLMIANQNPDNKSGPKGPREIVRKIVRNV